MRAVPGRAAAVAAVATMVILTASCHCQPLVIEELASGTLPNVGARGATELSYRLTAPRSGDLMVQFARRDGRTHYVGGLYLFVTRGDCASLTDRPHSLNDFDPSVLKCSTLANSITADPQPQGYMRLASPARVRAGQDLKVFVYALSTPVEVPFGITCTMGDANCGP